MIDKKTKLVIFDAYGVTLTGGFPPTMKWLGKRFKKDWKKLFDVFYKKYFNMAAERKITQREAWERPIKELQLPIKWKDLRDKHYSFMDINKKVINLVKKLNKETNTLLLSKNTRTQFYDVNKILNFKSYFKHAINTWELNLPKASKETCRYIFRRFNVKPEEVIYIDDQKNNLTDAKKLGVHTIFYKNFTQFKKDFHKVYKR